MQFVQAITGILVVIGLALLPGWMIKRNVRRLKRSYSDGDLIGATQQQLIKERAESEAFSSIYRVGCWITFVPVFIGCWIYCIDTHGFLLGVGLGWLPSAIVGVIAAFLWPLIVVLIFVVALKLS